ncbi:CbiX/SirB N-terminal domain-containing protein [Marinomonas sp.]|nr:CbiX/SirB N-terminal domain-containing protein [Marinomonas sp.]MDB4837065.1 CbiX/SirB N-terminal domain-containing protein [Marinomonas sp.]
MLGKNFDHIILLAHGSPDPLWKQPFELLYAEVTKVYGTERSSLAYMELTSPTLEDAVAALSSDVKNLAVLPLFLAVGRHLRHDVPKQIKALQHDQLHIELLSPIGDDSIVKNAMRTAIAQHLGQA